MSLICTTFLENIVTLGPYWYTPKHCYIWPVLAHSKILLHLARLGTLQNIVTFGPSWYTPKHCYIWPILVHSKTLLHLASLGTLQNTVTLARLGTFQNIVTLHNIVAIDPSCHIPKYCCIWPVLAYSKTRRKCM